ncbi:MAG: hypothetical protein HYY96_02230 [Candidatus Tectomicrobia bacterium]|nr:hypothetical protein [Candidatus Tectomicrobia bacterium]
MNNSSFPVTLSQDERQTLEYWLRMSTTEQRRVLRASTRALGVSTPTNTKWRRRFATERLAGLQDAPRPLFHGWGDSSLLFSLPSPHNTISHTLSAA